ncbi:MAG TPA: branched-chain amino acid ABC transporter permease, partial [Candidatus Udaeobacter sp.]|nr:branched-chain amino acid ABC transporter permease [Candidatus Udaeobacter sp.]
MRAWLRSAPPRYWLIVLAIIFFAALPTVTSSFMASEWGGALILAIAIMGLNILVGYSGQLSLGHGAFMALGAYTSAVLAHHYKVDYLVTIPIAGLLTGVVGFMFGIPALRLSPLYLALAT